MHPANHVVRIGNLKELQSAALDHGDTETWMRLQNEIRDLEAITHPRDGRAARAARAAS